MAEIDALVVKLEAQNAELLSVLKESTKATQSAMKNMEDAVGDFSKNATKSTTKFDDILTVFAGTTLANVVVKAAALAMEAIKEFGAAIGEGIQEASEYDKILYQLGNSIAANGKYTKGTISDLDQWINKMEIISGVDDAVIAKNLQLLSSLTRLDSEGLKRAQQSALDLSAAIGIDLGAATSLIGKAANGNVDAFKRYGITLQETGNKAVDFENALKTIEARFGGSSAASMKTFAGALTGLQNGFGNLFQEIGKVIISNPIVTAGIQKLAEVLLSLKTYVEQNATALSQGLSEALIGVTKISAVFLDMLGRLWNSLKLLYEGIMVVVNTFVDLGNALNKLNDFDLSGAAKEFDNTGQRIKNVNDLLNGPVNNSFTDMRDKVLEFGITSEKAFDESGKAAKDADDKFKNNKDTISELTELEKSRLAQAQAFGQELFNQAISVTEAYNLQQQSLQLSYEADLINFESYKAAKLESQMAQFEQEKLLLEQSQLTKEQMALAESALGQKQAVERFKLLEDMRKAEETNNKARIQGFSSFFGNLSSLQQTSSKELAAIGKGAALAQATIDGYAAIQGAYKQGAIIGGPALGAAFGAAAAAATAVNVAKIAGVGLKSGIDSVPGVGTGDSFPAILAPGERVVPTKTNEDLTDFLSNQQENNPSPIFNLNFYGPVWSNKAEAGAEIIEAINEAYDRGMGLRFRQA